MSEIMSGTALVLSIVSILLVWYFSLYVNNLATEQLRRKHEPKCTRGTWGYFLLWIFFILQAGVLAYVILCCGYHETETVFFSRPIEKMAYELFDSQFSHLLTVITILISVFGLAIPLATYFFQRQELKEERKRIEKDIKNKTAKLAKKAKRQKKTTGALRESLKDAYIVLSQFYIDRSENSLKQYRANKKIEDLMEMVFTWGNTLKCLVNARDKGNLISQMEKITSYASTLLSDEQCCKRVVALLYSSFPKEQCFVTKKSLVKVLGVNSDVYQEFVKTFSFFYDYKA